MSTVQAHTLEMEVYALKMVSQVCIRCKVFDRVFGCDGEIGYAYKNVQISYPQSEHLTF